MHDSRHVGGSKEELRSRASAAALPEEQLYILRRDDPEKFINPLRVPEDEEWGRVERYYRDLLRQDDYTLGRILKEHFTDHEVQLFFPVRTPPELVIMQRDHTTMFNIFMEHRLKGCAPTIEFKLTCMHFGIPVSPFQLGVPQGLERRPENDDAEPNDELHRPALDWLDAYTERTWGRDKARCKRHKPLPSSQESREENCQVTVLTLPNSCASLQRRDEGELPPAIDQSPG